MDFARPVPPAAMDALRAAARLAQADATAAPDRVAILRDLTWDARMIEAMDPGAFSESFDLMRFGRREI